MKDAIARKTETPSDAAVDYIFEILSEIASSDREEFPHLTRATAHTNKNNPKRESSPTFSRSPLEKGYVRESPQSSLSKFSEQKKLPDESSDAVSSSTAKFEMESEYEPRPSVGPVLNVSDPYEGRFVRSQQNLVSNIKDKHASIPSSETLCRPNMPAASKRSEASLRASDDEILSMIHQLQNEVKPVKMTATSPHTPSPYMSAAEPSRYDKKEASSNIKNAKIEHSDNFGQNKSSFGIDSLKKTNKNTTLHSSTSKSSSKKIETRSRASDDDILSMIRKLQKEVKPTKMSTQSSQSSTSYMPAEESSRYSRHDNSTYKGNPRAEHFSQDYNESAYTTNILKEPFKQTTAKAHSATAQSLAEPVVADLATLLLQAVQMTITNKPSEDKNKTAFKHSKSGFTQPPYDDHY